MGFSLLFSIFSATVAQEYSKFWVGIESPRVNVVQRGVPILPSYGISTTRRPFSPGIPNYNNNYPSRDALVRNRFFLLVLRAQQTQCLNLLLGPSI